MRKHGVTHRMRHQSGARRQYLGDEERVPGRPPVQFPGVDARPADQLRDRPR
jgi:hypothetical protein